MTYDVLKEFTDETHRTIDPADGEKKPLHLKHGAKFIPAETGYPQNKVDELVKNGTIKLIEAPKPAKKK